MNALYFLIGFAFCFAALTGDMVKALAWALTVLVLVAAEYWKG